MDPRLDLVRYYRWLRQYGLNDSHSGNLSVRCDTDYWITPTGACADTLVIDELVRCPLDGPPPAGASLDAPLHREVYLRNPGSGAVVHSHGPYSVAITLNGEDFLPPDFEGQYYFRCIPVLDIPYADYVERAPSAVAEGLVENPVVVVRGHGVYARAENLNLAYKWTCSFESSAKTAWLFRQMKGWR
jgi:L-fuculose-phosphate aldolase